ncbi:MAG: hypothetical protein KF809_13620 [Chloroflexi bacterium]|nr:hypothetical protein [Chloroflexota bacterium]
MLGLTVAFTSVIDVAAADPSSAPPVEASAGPSLDQSAGLVHDVVGGLGFDRPAAWALRPSDVDMRYIRVLAFVGTAPSSAGCTTTPDTMTCGTDFALQPGTVSVAIEWVHGPPARRHPFDRAADPEPGTRVVFVDGMPAIRSGWPDHAPGADAPEMQLMVPFRDSIIGGTRFRARVQGPGADVLWQQVSAMLDSVHYEPALRPTEAMDAAAAAAAAARALDQLADGDRAYACFPREPGTSRKARVRKVPSYSRLRRAAPMTCTTTIEGMPLELWHMTLTQTWTDGPGRKAGALTTTVWVGLDGEPGWTMSGGSRTNRPPYWPRRPRP